MNPLDIISRFSRKLEKLVRRFDDIFDAFKKGGVAAGGAAAGQALVEFFSTSTEEIVGALKAVQQAVETGLEALRTTLVSSVAAITGDPAAREKIDKLDEAAGKRDQLAELNAESRIPSTAGATDISALVGLDNEVIALEQEATATPLDTAAAGQGLTELCEAFTAKLGELALAIDALAEKSAAAMGGVSAGVEAVEGEALEAGAAMGDEAADTLEEAFTRMDQAAENTFARIAQSGLGASDLLQQAFGSLDGILQGALGKLGPLFSKLFGGGPLKALTSVLGFAGGGAVQPGAPILVGERGAEIFLPSGPGRILNAHNTARAVGGGAGVARPLVVHQTVNFSTDIKNTVRAEILNALPMASNIATQNVINLMRGIRI